MKRVNKLAIYKAKNLSIKHLTVLGFSFVCLPLIIGLTIAAISINNLATKSAYSISDAAELIRTNRSLGEILENMERNASQSIVLQDQSLKNTYFDWQHKLNQETLKHFLDHPDKQLASQGALLIEYSSQLSRLFKDNLLTLEDVQRGFIKLQNTYKQLRSRGDQLIGLHSNSIKEEANELSTKMVYGLLLLPFVIIIATIFIYLITSPIRKITNQIRLLEKGKFEHSIKVEGSVEIVEVADALETMRQRLHALELQKSSFIRHISHELKTPLAAIREGAELLYDNSVGPLNNGQIEICNIIRSSSNRLQHLIEDLLDFNIVLDSTSLQDKEMVVLRDIVDKVIIERQLDIQSKHLIVKPELENIQLQSNGQQLQVVLDNLISNAIKFSPEKGEIKLTAKAQGNKMCLGVADQGPGIPQESLDKVFDAFYQGRKPTNSKIKSSGLGLTIVKELLLRLNGNIALKNNEDGQGICACVTIPGVINKE